jgi:hypothetical protein
MKLKCEHENMGVIEVNKNTRASQIYLTIKIVPVQVLGFLLRHDPEKKHSLMTNKYVCIV